MNAIIILILTCPFTANHHHNFDYCCLDSKAAILSRSSGINTNWPRKVTHVLSGQPPGVIMASIHVFCTPMVTEYVRRDDDAAASSSYIRFLDKDSLSYSVPILAGFKSPS